MRHTLHTLRLLTLALPALLLGACVTINIYFPAAAAEKAADKIIEDVWGEEGKKGEGSHPEPISLAPPSAWPVELLEWLVPAAQAAEADLSIDTPAIRRLTDAMNARHQQLEPHYASGAVGLTGDALIDTRDLSQVPLKQRAEVNRLVAEENRDRNALYREIAGANGHPEWEAEIRATFARRWIDKARGGWWYQEKGGAWQKK